MNLTVNIRQLLKKKRQCSSVFTECVCATDFIRHKATYFGFSLIRCIYPELHLSRPFIGTRTMRTLSSDSLLILFCVNFVLCINIGGVEAKGRSRTSINQL